MNDKMAPTAIFLEPATVFVNREATVISTVLGSAVAVTLWERKKKFGGMCHFIFPKADASQRRTVEYGNVAIYALIKAMNDFGSNLKDLEAQIFGGAEPLDIPVEKKTFGPKNIEAARTALQKYRIRVISEDIGGHVGRKISFNTQKNEVVAYKVKNIRNQDWHFM